MKYLSKSYHWLTSFFFNYAWLGVILILLSIIGQHENTSGNEYLSIFFEVLVTIGIAVLVASIFTFASGTSQFMDKVRELLSEIVLTRDFLSKIDSESKRDAIRAVIRPSSDQRKIYANIEDYYDSQIEKALSVSKKCVRSQYKLNCHPFWDEEHNVIIVDQYASYRLYPSTNGYDNIKVAFYDHHAEKKPECLYVNISSPLKGKKRIERKNLELTEQIVEGQKVLFGEVSLGEMGHQHPHLDIDMHLREIGRSHWQVVGFQTLLPTDGFAFIVKCTPPVKVQSVNSFWAGSGLHINERSDYILSASSTQWMSEGTGISVVVSTTDEENIEANGENKPGDDNSE